MLLILLSAETLKRRWRNLRDLYIKKKKLMKTTSGQAASRVDTWLFFKELTFLDDFIDEIE